jgi:hypothetical protein
MNKKDQYYGKKIILNGPVVPVDLDEDMKVHMKCYEFIAKMYKQIQETETSTMDIRDLIKDIENG